jgi:hypothetical protein
MLSGGGRLTPASRIGRGWSRALPHAGSDRGRVNSHSNARRTSRTMSLPCREAFLRRHHAVFLLVNKPLRTKRGAYTQKGSGAFRLVVIGILSQHSQSSRRCRSIVFGGAALWPGRMGKALLLSWTPRVTFFLHCGNVHRQYDDGLGRRQ